MSFSVSPCLCGEFRSVLCGPASGRRCEQKGLDPALEAAVADDLSGVVDVGGLDQLPARARRYKLVQVLHRAVVQEGVRQPPRVARLAHDLTGAVDRLGEAVPPAQGAQVLQAASGVQESVDRAARDLGVADYLAGGVDPRGAAV